MPAIPGTRAAVYSAALAYFAAAMTFALARFFAADEPLTAGPVALALGLAPLIAVVGPRLPRPALGLLGPIATSLVAWALVSSSAPGDGAVLYMWPVLWTAHFFPRAWTAVTIAWTGAAHAGALLVLTGAVDFGRWIEVMVAVTAVGTIGAIKSIREERVMRQLADEARVDPLTGLLNRRGLDERLAVERARAGRSGASMAVVSFDLDHFKRVNDAHGHEAGDRVLAWFAARMRDQARGVDACARVGGEEFVAVLPDGDLDAGATFAERVRAAMTATPCSLSHITASAGVAAADQADVDALFALADEALYAAKRGGRDRVCVRDHSMPGMTPQHTLAAQAGPACDSEPLLRVTRAEGGRRRRSAADQLH